MVEKLDGEEEVDTAVYIRYTNRKIYKRTRYEPTFQGKWQKDDDRAMLLNYGYTLVSISTQKDEIKQELGVIMDQQYSLKAGLKRFGRKGEMCSDLISRAVT